MRFFHSIPTLRLDEPLLLVYPANLAAIHRGSLAWPPRWSTPVELRVFYRMHQLCRLRIKFGNRPLRG
jgi:hypothetical protein